MDENDKRLTRLGIREADVEVHRHLFGDAGLPERVPVGLGEDGDAVAGLVKGDLATLALVEGAPRLHARDHALERAVEQRAEASRARAVGEGLRDVVHDIHGTCRWRSPGKQGGPRSGPPCLV